MKSNSNCLFASMFLWTLMGSAVFAQPPADSLEPDSSSQESPICIAGRMALDWARRVGPQVGAAQIASKHYYIVDGFNVEDAYAFRRPKKVSKKLWNLLEKPQNAPYPSSCENLDAFSEPPVFLSSIEEARSVRRAALVIFSTTRMTSDATNVALKFRIEDPDNKTALTGVITPFIENGEWRLGPQMLGVSYSSK